MHVGATSLGSGHDGAMADGGELWGAAAALARGSNPTRGGRRKDKTSLSVVWRRRRARGRPDDVGITAAIVGTQG